MKSARSQQRREVRTFSHPAGGLHCLIDSSTLAQWLVRNLDQADIQINIRLRAIARPATQISSIGALLFGQDSPSRGH